MTAPAPTRPTPPWHVEAACRDVDPDVFYPDTAALDAARAAKRVCAACPVREPCLAWALEHRENLGVWGGLTPWERDRVGRLRRDTATAQILASRLADPDRPDGVGARSVEMAVRYQAGETASELARRFRVSEQTVRSRLRVLGVEMRPSGPLSSSAVDQPDVGVCSRGHRLTSDNRWGSGRDRRGRQRWECAQCKRDRRTRQRAA